VAGVRYCNDGDWVEHCSALVEDRTGRLAIVHSAGAVATPIAAPPVEAAPDAVTALETAA
jgi:hypothetical protein